VHRIILASSSPTRHQLLQSVGIPFESVPPRIDEVSVRASLEAEGATPRDIADTLGEMKARKAAEKTPEALVIGSDQVLSLKGRVFGKPEDRDAAAAQIGALQGQQHMLLSSAVIYQDGGPIWRSVGTARLTMHALTPDDIEAYLAVAWPDVEGSAGAYHAEGYGARLFSRIDGDWFTVMGMPLLDICSFLRLRGWLDP